MPKLTEARKKANKKWDENNKDRKKLQRTLFLSRLLKKI